MPLLPTIFPLAEKPRFDLGKGDIVTVYPGASAKDIESNITSKIEKELLSISGLKEFTSTSETGVSNISVVLDSNVSDPNTVYQDIRDALARVTDLPAGVTEAPTLSIKNRTAWISWWSVFLVMLVIKHCEIKPKT